MGLPPCPSMFQEELDKVILCLPSCSLSLAKGLGRMLKNLHNENKINGLSLNADIEPQTHQQFVDDMMLMGPSTV